MGQKINYPDSQNKNQSNDVVSCNNLLLAIPPKGDSMKSNALTYRNKEIYLFDSFLI
jgi:hypothetical protein